VHDQSGRALHVGDPVTVIRTSDRPLYWYGSHGSVVSFGTKRVKIEVTTAAFPSRDGDIETFLPDDLVYGHRGHARNSDRLRDATSTFAESTLREAIDWGVEAGVVSESQGEQLIRIWRQRRQLPDQGRLGDGSGT
jgi:hypothetical protein